MALRMRLLLIHASSKRPCTLPSGGCCIWSLAILLSGVGLEAL